MSVCWLIIMAKEAAVVVPKLHLIQATQDCPFARVYSHGLSLWVSMPAVSVEP